MKSKKNSRAESKTEICTTVSLPVVVWHLLSFSLLFFAGLFCYSNTFSVPFILDDVTSILVNPLVKNFDFRLKSRILGDLSFALNYRLHGLDLAGYHVVNLLLHLLNAGMVYLLVQMIFATPLLKGFDGEKTVNRPAAPILIGLGAAIMFVCHPLQTQAVTYLAQRVALLAAFFYLGALLCYLCSRLSNRAFLVTGLLALSLLLSIAGVLSKENAVTIPFSILLFEVTFFRGELKRRVLSIIWYLIPMIVAPMMMLGRIGFSSDLLGEVSRITAESGAPSRAAYLLTQPPVIVSYLRLFFFPVGQNIDHDVLLRNSLLDPTVLLSTILLTAFAAAGVGLWWVARRARDGQSALLALPAFGIGWFFITLSIESGLVPIRDVMFEHRMYLPSVGLVIAFSALVWCWTIRLSRGDAQRRVATVFTGVLIGSVLLLGAVTFIRNKVWHSEVTLWEDAVSKSPAKGRAHGALGHAYQRAGRFVEAEKAYMEAVRLAPKDHIARNNLGAIYLKQRRYSEAAGQFKAALELAPATTAAHFNLGLVYGALGRLVEAEASFAAAVRLKPDYREARENLTAVQKARRLSDLE